jgi:hypothetical protein
MMRNVRIWTLLGATLLATGCGDLISLHALYTAQDRVFDAKLEGKWDDKDNWLIVERAGDGYDVTLESKKHLTDPSKFEMRLVDIAGVRFADLLPSDTLGHMFLKLRVTEGELRLAFMDSEWLRKRIPHEEADLVNHRKQDVLTAHTPELRNLVAKYAAEPKAYGEEVVFQRAK